MADQPESTAAAGGAKKNTGRKRGTTGADQLAARLAGLAGQAGQAKPDTTTTARATRTPAARTAPARTGRAATTTTGRGTKTVTTATPMAAEQAKPASSYGARISHATTPEQLAELEQIRLAENTARRAAKRPALSVTALLRAATQICLDNDRLRAQMIKRAGEEWG
jgi:hypothetical protein